MMGGHERPPPSPAEMLARRLTPRQLLEAGGAALYPGERGDGEFVLHLYFNDEWELRFYRLDSRHTDGMLDQPLAE